MLGLQIVGGVLVGCRALRAHFEPEAQAFWQFFAFSISRLASPLRLP